jgi:hypothetical protein
MKFSSSTIKDRLTSMILLCRASQLSLDRLEAICNGWILDWKRKQISFIATFHEASKTIVECINTW